MILPEPSAGFQWRHDAPGPALVCPALEPFARHFFTTRNWALGSAALESMEAAWADVAGAAEVPVERLVRARQIHGADVLVAQAGGVPAASLPEADIIVARDPAAALAIQTADCVPVILVDRRTGTRAAAHAGWRGLAAGVPGIAVEAMARECGCRPPDLLAVAGPSIGACCYEVGEDVRARFAAAFSGAQTARWLRPRPAPTAVNPSMRGLPSPPRESHWYFDGWSATRDQLEAAGIPSAQIFIAELCTASHPDAFCSYRRDGKAAGRMAAVVGPARN